MLTSGLRSNMTALVAVWAVLVLAVAAAPSALPGTVVVRQVSSRRVPSPIKVTETRDVEPAVCTTGLPASRQRQSVYPIDDYSYVGPATAMTSYKIKKQWYDEHFITGPHYMSFTHKSDPYGAFKCQYICNAQGSCHSYFGWYEGVGTDSEYFNCVLFDAILDPTFFVPFNGTGVIGAGGYDKICR